MAKSPGHREHPEHRVDERPADGVVRVRVGGEVVAESDRAVRVDEDGSPPRYYLPREDVKLPLLEPSETTSGCPFKGTARYFHVQAAGRRFDDAAWSYEEPYDEHRGLKSRIAFYDENHDDITVETVH